METYFILLVKMRNLSPNGSGQGIKLEEASWQNNYILFYWMEQHDMRSNVFRQSDVLEVNKC